MSYAFIIVAAVAITFKVLFMSFSLYFTIKSGKQEAQIQTSTAKQSKSMAISWKRVTRKFLPKSLYCPDDANKNYVDRM